MPRYEAEFDKRQGKRWNLSAKQKESLSLSFLYIIASALRYDFELMLSNFLQVC